MFDDNQWISSFKKSAQIYYGYRALSVWIESYFMELDNSIKRRRKLLSLLRLMSEYTYHLMVFLEI